MKVNALFFDIHSRMRVAAPSSLSIDGPGTWLGADPSSIAGNEGTEHFAGTDGSGRMRWGGDGLSFD